jgi:glyoxylase I family protein
VTERLLDIAGGELQAVYLKLDGTCIELLYYPVAGHETPDTPRPMNLLGLTHLSFTVADVDAVVAAVTQAGGRYLDHTRIEHEGKSTAIFVTDPDGMRIELVQARGNSNTPPGG